MENNKKKSRITLQAVLDIEAESGAQQGRRNRNEVYF